MYSRKLRLQKIFKDLLLFDFGIVVNKMISQEYKSGIRYSFRIYSDPPNRIVSSDYIKYKGVRSKSFKLVFKHHYRHILDINVEQLVHWLIFIRVHKNLIKKVPHKIYDEIEERITREKVFTELTR
jgi:hypothetical protein